MAVGVCNTPYWDERTAGFWVCGFLLWGGFWGKLWLAGWMKDDRLMVTAVN